MEKKSIDTIRDLGLSDEKIKEIAIKLDWDVEEVLDCDDFHLEDTAEEMVAWMFEYTNELINVLTETYPRKTDVTLFDSLLESLTNVFKIDGEYIMFYV